MNDKKDIEKMGIDKFIEECKKRIANTFHGEFGTDMKVDLQNDGPFTIILDSNEL